MAGPTKRKSRNNNGIKKKTRTNGYTRRVVPRIPGSEMKFFDTIRAAVVPGSTGTILNNCLNIIPQGAVENNRIGRKCVIKSVMVHGNTNLPSTTTFADASDSVRFILYLDRQANGIAATITGILETASIDSFGQLANSSRFKTIGTWMHNLSADAASGNGTTDTTFEKSFQWAKYFKCEIPIEWDNSATTGVLTSVRSNNIGMLAITKSGVMIVEYTVRLRFSDR